MEVVKRVVSIAIAAIFGVGNAMAGEEAEYAVMLSEQSFEIRLYESHILAETTVESDFDSAGNKAFSRLFKYISGNNISQQKVDMTSPVSQEAASEKIDMTSPVGQQKDKDRWAVSFMMPASYSLETLPEPKDPEVILRQVPARYVAAIRYSGIWSEKAYQRHKGELEAWIEIKGSRVVGEPVWARYDPPFMPWFLRRNEILIPVAKPVAL
jgi:hypothetical protein